MKSTWLAGALAAIVLGFPGSAYANDFDQLPGTYSSKETTFVTLKRLTFTKAKDGSIKIQGALVGFPDEVSIGEATAEPCARNRDKSNPDILLASFSSEKYKPFIVLTPSSFDGKHFKFVNFTCYMKDVDGSKVHIEGYLERDQ